MASGRQTNQASQPQEISLLRRLQSINTLVKVDIESAERACRQLEKIVSSVFQDSYKHKKIVPEEHELFCGILNYMATTYCRDSYNSLCVSVPLIRARYWTRRWKVDKALAIYEEVEARYPDCVRAYSLHGYLLFNLNREEESDAVFLKYNEALERAKLRKKEVPEKTISEPPKLPEPAKILARPKHAEQSFSLFSCQDFLTQFSGRKTAAPSVQSDFPLYKLFK